MMLIIDRLTDTYHQYFSHVTTWYHAADALTQDVVIMASAIVIFLVSTIMLMARMTR